MATVPAVRLWMKKSIIDRAAEALRTYRGVDPKLGAASTDCNIPLSIGIPSIMVPCGMGAGAHTRGEYIEIDSMVPGIKFATAMVMHHF